MKKKILVTASTFPRWECDTEPRFVLDLCKAMNEYFDITVLVPAAPGAKDNEVLDGINVIRYHYFPIHRLETLCYPGAIVPRIKEKKIRALLVPFLFVGLWNALRKNVKGYDIVHAHWLIPQGIVQSFFDTPYILTGHGGDVYSLNKGIVKKLKIKCLKKAHKVSVVSEPLKKELQLLVPNIEATVIPMGVDIQAFDPQFRIVNLFMQDNKKVILFVGRLAEKKGVTYLIEAMKYIDALLVIVGDGPLKSELEAQAFAQSNSKQAFSEPSLQGVKYGNILFLGSRTHEELKTIYASADIFCAPSITAKNGDQEGVPTVLFEAMASGLPPVVSNSGGMAQIINNYENGMLCEEKNVWQLIDSISALIDDEDLYNKLRSQCLRDAQENSYINRAKSFRLLIENPVDNS